MQYKRGKIWWIKFKTQGRTIQRSSGSTLRREAREFESELRKRVARELHLQRTGSLTKMLYGDALLRWINEGAPKSMWSHARNTRPYLDDVPLHLVVPGAHQMKVAMLKDGLSPQTINRRLAVVRRVLNVAYKEWDWISEPLGQKIQLLSEKGMEREFYLSQDEVLQLLAAVQGDQARSILRLAAFTGMRKSEIIRLKPEHWQKPYIILPSQTKSKKPRSIPVIELCHPDLDALPFSIGESRLRTEFEKAREAIGRPDIRMHDLRHTFASWLAKSPDVPMTVIRDILGHSNLAVTSRYSHLRGQHLGLVEGALSGKKGDKEG